MTGTLIKTDDRPDIVFEDGSFYGGLHCGECFSIFEPTAGWIPVRLEFTEDWVLWKGSEIETVHIPYGSPVMLWPC